MQRRGAFYGHLKPLRGTKLETLSSQAEREAQADHRANLTHPEPASCADIKRGLVTPPVLIFCEVKAMVPGYVFKPKPGLQEAPRGRKTAKHLPYKAP
jgi:hypothetical protein